MSSVDRKAQMHASGRDLVNVVWPLIGPLMQGGTLIPVETVTTDRMAKHLDVYAGIDAWQVLPDQTMRGIASRVRYGRAYNDFTVRALLPSGADTEWQKRLYAHTHPHLGLLTPQWTITAYLDGRGGQLTSAAAVKTESLIRYIVDHLDILPMRFAGSGGEGFYAVGFRKLARWGADVILTDGSGAGQTTLEVA